MLPSDFMSLSAIPYVKTAAPARGDRGRTRLLSGDNLGPQAGNNPLRLGIVGKWNIELLDDILGRIDSGIAADLLVEQRLRGFVPIGIEYIVGCLGDNLGP